MKTQLLLSLFILFLCCTVPVQAQMWDELGGGVDGLGVQVKALEYDPLGPGGPTLYVAGIFDEAGGTPGFNNIGALNLITGLWIPMGTGFDGEVTDLVLDPISGDLYAGGNFDFDGGGVTEFNGVAQWNGSSWSALVFNGEEGTFGDVQALALDSNGNLYVGGSFNIPATPMVNESNIAMWNGSSWSALGTGMNLGTDGLVKEIVIDAQDDVYVGGTFVSVANGTVDACRVAKYDGTWSALGAGVDGDVDALVFDPFGNLYVGGGFDDASDTFDSNCNTYSNPVEANSIAVWDGANWTGLVDAVTEPPFLVNGLSSTVRTLIVADVLGLTGAIVAGGFFSDAGCDSFCPIGHPNNGADRIAVWAPSPVLGIGAWLPLELGFNQPALAIAFAPSITLPNGSLVDVSILSAGGTFTQGGNGAPMSRLAQFQVQLPVELTAFDVLVDGDDVILRWATASETDNAGFYVEMNRDAVRPRHAVASDVANPSDWQTLAFIEGHGTTTEPQSYTYRVSALPPGPHRFRLKQIDFDGQFEYSAEVEVVHEVPGSHVLGAIYPNPFGADERAAFTLALARDQHVAVEVFDAVGRQVRTVHDGMLQTQINHRFILDGSGLPKGLYLVRVTGEGFSESRRVVLLH